MRGRFYDPALGRFLSPDQVVSDPSSSQALNRYSYVRNRPLRLTDPSGLDPITSPSQVDSEFNDNAYVMMGCVGRTGACNSGSAAEPTTQRFGERTTTSQTDSTTSRAATSAGTTGTGGTPSTASTTGTGGTGGSGGSGGQPASVGVAVAAGVGGLAVGAGVSTAITYGLGMLSAACLPCAVGVGIGVAAVAVYKLLDGGARSIYDSGDRIVHGQGNGLDYFTIGNVIGGAAAGGVSSRVFASGRATAGALLAPRAAATVVETATTTVGRWMSPAEHSAMLRTGRVQAPLNGAGATHVTVPPNPAAFTPPPQSALFVEFKVPTAHFRVHDPGAGWGRVFGPGSLEARLAGAKGLPGATEMPTATDIQVTNP